MKHFLKILSAGVLIFLVAITAIGMWQPSLLILGSAFISTEFAAKWYADWRETVVKRDPEEQMQNLENEVIQIQMGEHQFNIPMRYTYRMAIEKHGRWPKAKPNRVDAQYIRISTMLPDLKPYHVEDDEKWKALGWGDRLEATLSSETPRDFIKMREKFLNDEEKYFRRAEDKQGLLRFVGQGGFQDRYFAKTSDLNLYFYCNPEPKTAGRSPSCTAYTRYGDNLSLNYSFAKEKLEEWKRIHTQFTTLLNQFEKSAQPITSEKENQK
ncbi:MAG: hypothetical protein HC848_04220 [Limnobacter sp.]|nr:hypothetical protein [Limnobacter sp.]